jgi:hypothetical protein
MRASFSFLGSKLGRIIGGGLGFLLPLTLPAAASATPPAVEVVVGAIDVEQRVFDPQNPPADMPRLKHPEAALCHYQFSCQSQASVESARKLFKLKPATITAVKIWVGLKVTIWLPSDGTAKLAAHERAHQQICEKVYARAEAVARELGARLIGHTLIHTLKDEAAVQAELGIIQNDLTAAYMREVEAPCARMQRYLDSITQHGTNALGEDEAVARAVAQEPSMAAGRP